MKKVAEDLPVAACTVDVYLVASFIGILGNIINGAVKGCDKKNTVETPGFSGLFPLGNAHESLP